MAGAESMEAASTVWRTGKARVMWSKTGDRVVFWRLKPEQFGDIYRKVQMGSLDESRAEKY